MSNNSPQQTYNQYKMRKISESQKGAITFGIGMPPEVATRFVGVKFNIEINGDNIILTSGLDIAQLKKEIENIDINEW